VRPILILLVLAALAAAEVTAPAEWLVIAPVDKRSRRPFNPDALFARYLWRREAPPPREGDAVKGTAGEAKWTRATADEKGAVAGSIYLAYAPLASDRDRIVRARLPGGAILYVNGDAYVGSVYGGRSPGVAVPLRKGTNHLFVRGVRGRFRLVLEEVGEPGLLVAAEDATLPDLVVGRPVDVEFGVAVLNASPEARDGTVPFGVRRHVHRLSAPAPVEAGECPTEVGGTPFTLKVKEAAAPRRVTFRSAIDGTVQQYSVLAPTGDGPAGLVLSLHGAGVDALGQARSYSPKPHLWIVAPTNRRPFGFDWQDWGRRDAYEVLAHALAWTGADPARVYLTGHSMGGHGTWHLAANDADGFAAIAPSAGWCSFDTYAGGRVRGRLTDRWHGADLPSLTLEFVDNLVQVPTFILHGEDDDNVPVTEARRMEKALRAAGADPIVHYQPGVKHWWSGDAAKGVDCVDWPGIFALFRECRKSSGADEIRFLSADPAVDADHHWLHVHQPLVYGRKLGVRARRSADAIEIETENVRRFRVDAPRTRLVVDGQTLLAPARPWLLRTPLGWTVEAPPAGEKSPARSGPFKRAFDRRFVLVYGEHDREGRERARYDAQVWWYRANGDAEVVSDAAFLAGDYRGRNVILYGNEDGNRAFLATLSVDCPLRVREGRIDAGAEHWEGAALGCVFVYPRRGAAAALVGVFGHTGPAGARLGYTLLPFVSGVGYPDYAVFDERILAEGDGGVRAAGWFDHAWRLKAR
jgi:poly(3-hydroxybutyrate) depolymerase